MLTSILLPVFNGANYIEESIKSILLQQGDWELIIQDDCSTDKTEQICKKYICERVKYFRNARNLNCFGSLNAAAKNATGGLLRLFSHDDNMLPDDILIAGLYMKNNPEIGLSFSNYDMIDGKGVITGSSFDFVERNKNLPEKISGSTAAKQLYRWGCISGTQSNITLRKEVYIAIKQFNSELTYTGDFDLLARAGIKFGLGYNKAKTCQIRFHPVQTSKEGGKQMSKLSEMKIITDYLLENIEESERDLYDRKFGAVYGYYLIKQPMKELVKGKFESIKFYFDTFGFKKTADSMLKALYK